YRSAVHDAIEFASGRIRQVLQGRYLRCQYDHMVDQPELRRFYECAQRVSLHEGRRPAKWPVRRGLEEPELHRHYALPVGAWSDLLSQHEVHESAHGAWRH